MTASQNTKLVKTKQTRFHKMFAAHLTRLGLRQTRQRKLILDAVIASERHVDAETVAKEAKKRDSSIGLATVYRTLRMMTDAQILVERHFVGGRATFEFADEKNSHHDHLICNQCGEILEFFEEQLETLQDQIALRMGFRLTRHKMDLFADCLKNETCEHKIKRDSL